MEHPVARRGDARKKLRVAQPDDARRAVRQDLGHWPTTSRQTRPRPHLGPKRRPQEPGRAVVDTGLAALARAGDVEGVYRVGQ